VLAGKQCSFLGTSRAGATPPPKKGPRGRLKQFPSFVTFMSLMPRWDGS